ncbi:MAG: hypothetical protein AVDCRST_MAG33-2640, partial [uncultured Thermomicrobiales bacterium]
RSSATSTSTCWSHGRRWRANRPSPSSHVTTYGGGLPPSSAASKPAAGT